VTATSIQFWPEGTSTPVCAVSSREPRLFTVVSR
jgi:hypothetical protein